VIVDPLGTVRAGPAEPGSAAILTANGDLTAARDKRWGDRNDLIADRRTDVYQP